MGLHTGEPMLVPPKYVGLDVHRAARVMAAAHGGQVLLTDATRSGLTGQLALRELGVHRLKDLLQPEPLYQVVIPGLRSHFPALKTLGNRPNNLPVVATPFIGRVQELATVQELLLREQVRLLTLTGPGGIGKTRLALQAAADVVERFRDGVYWVPLAPIRDPGLVAATLAQVLGLAERPGEPIGETIDSYLADKQMLLALDNLEHVVDAARELTAAILATAPRVRIVATTREALRISAEHLYEVPALALPDGSDPSFDDPVDAVELFVSRAQAADSAFALTEANAKAVAEIVCRLDGLPLAIELAAARSRALPPQALALRLGERLRLLTRGAPDAHERHHTLRATINWSYELLSQREQGLFAVLGVFIGGCRLEAVEAIYGGADDLDIDVLDDLASLIDKSLVRRRVDPHSGQPRYWMLETMREFALEQLSNEEEVRTRHAEWCRDLTERLDPSLRGSEAAEAYTLLTEELANLRNALAFALESGRSELYAELAAAAWYFWNRATLYAEGERHLSIAAQLKISDAVRMRVLEALAGMAVATGGSRAAINAGEEALALRRAQGDPAQVLRAMTNLATAYGALEEHSHARLLLDEARALAGDARDPWWQAVTLTNLGCHAFVTGETVAAEAYQQRAAELIPLLNDQHVVAAIRMNLGAALLRRDRVAEAVDQYRIALESVPEASAGPEQEIWCLEALAAAVARTDPATAAVIGAASRQACEDSDYVLAVQERHLRGEWEAIVGNALTPDDRAAYEREGRLLSVRDALREAFAFFAGQAAREVPSHKRARDPTEKPPEGRLS